MAKPFMRLSNIRKNSGSSIQGSIDYLARLNEYDNRNDVVSSQVYYLPQLYRSTAENEIDGLKEFYEDFEKYSRKDRRLALSVIFDLPLSNERKSLANFDKKIYPKIVKNFVDRLNESYSIVTDREGKKKTLRNDRINLEEYVKVEKLYIPSIYAIHLLEKEGDKVHPHCHMLISTLGYTKDDLMNCNCTKEDIIHAGINNKHLGQTAFYYDIYEYFSQAANEELLKLDPKNIDRYYLNLRNAEILREERKRFGEIASSFANMDVPQLSYLDNLMLNNAMYDLEKEYKLIDDELREVHKSSREISIMLNINESDEALLKFIAKRNRLSEKLIRTASEEIYSIEVPIFERKIGEDIIPTNYNGHRIVQNITDGIDVRDVVKPKVRIFGESLIPYSYDYGSMVEYNEEIEKKSEVFVEDNKNIENINRMLSKFKNEYLNAVKAYNGYDEEYLQNRTKGVKDGTIYNEIETVNVFKDESKKTRRLNNMVTRIAQMDYMIFSAIKGRNEGNMIKNCYARGKFEGEEKKWNLDEYVNLNSRIAYSLEKNEAVVSNYSQALSALELLKKKKKELELLYSRAKSASEKTQLSLEIRTAVSGINKIDDAIIKFERYEKPKLVEQFASISSKGIKMSPTVAARNEKEIAYFKNSLINLKRVEEGIGGVTFFSAKFMEAKRKYAGYVGKAAPLLDRL